MKKIFVIAAIAFMGLLSGCGPLQIPVALVQGTGQPAPNQIYFQPQPGQPATASQVVFQPQTPQGPPQQVFPQQGLAQDSMQQFGAQPLPTNQPRIQNTGFGGRSINPKHAGKVAGCDLFEMDLDVGPVTIAKCPGFDGPTFVQVSPATASRANRNRPGGGLLVYNGQKDELTEAPSEVTEK